MSDESRISLLIFKTMRNELTPGEERELTAWVNQSEKNRLFYENEINGEALKGVERSLAMDEERMDRRMAELLHPGKVKTNTIPFWRILAAAGIIGVLVIGGWVYFMNSRLRNKEPIAIVKGNDVGPGTNKAVLTLADGSTVALGGNRKGELARQNNAAIQQVDSGRILYTSLDGKPIGSMAYNVLTTPAGGQFQVTLPDGTKVWLNAASSLRYPTAFAGKERNVELTGEAYFEVAEDKKRPFTVLVNHASKVQVLGTHFNVFAYLDEESVKTTLLQGSVKVSKGKMSGILQPGEQAVVRPAGEQISIVKDIDVDDQVAWKDGLFRFDNTPLPVIMHQVARWYDVEVVYEEEVKRTFSGELPRNVNVSELLHFLESTDKVHFKVEGKKVTVMR